MLTPDGRAQAFRVTSYSWLTSSEIFCTKCLTSGSADCVPRLPRLWQGTVENLRVHCDCCSGFVLAVFVEVLLFYIHNSEVCHHPCVFKLYGDINSVKNTTINI